MTSDVKMYMLVSGMSVITYEEINERNEVLWQYPMGVIFIPPQRPGMEPNLHFNMLNHNLLSKTQNAFPNMQHIFYAMHPTETLVESYKKVVEEIKMKLAGLITSTKKVIAPI